MHEEPGDHRRHAAARLRRRGLRRLGLWSPAGGSLTATTLRGRSLTATTLRGIHYLNRGIAEPPACPPGWSVAPPDFVGVGAGRTGTSWWYDMIVDHPAVERVAGSRRRLRPWERSRPWESVPAVTLTPLRKELRFFDPLVERGLSATDADLYRRFFPRPEGSVCGEWSPSYMFDFWTPPLLARAAPQTRLLALLRDPVERLRSAIGLVARAGPLQRDSRLLFDVWSLERDRGRYWKHLSRLLDYFPREQLLLLQFERCTQDPAGELRRTYEFLGLEPLDHDPGPTTAGAPVRAKPDLREEVRSRLVAELEDDVRALARTFPTIDLELWPNFGAFS